MSAPGLTGRARHVLDSVSNGITSWKQKILSALPKNFSVWLIAITCLIILVAVSRILALQKSVTELQSRPVVDENVIRVAVRKHLEETVKAMEQHNKAQAMARQAEEAARMAEMQRVAAEQKAAAEAKALSEKAAAEKAVAEKVDVKDVEKEVPHVLHAQAKEEAKVEEKVKEDLDEEDEKPVVTATLLTKKSKSKGT